MISDIYDCMKLLFKHGIFKIIIKLSIYWHKSERYVHTFISYTNSGKHMQGEGILICRQIPLSIVRDNVCIVRLCREPTT